jgi:hypothetical protein
MTEKFIQNANGKSKADPPRKCYIPSMHKYLLNTIYCTTNNRNIHQINTEYTDLLTAIRLISIGQLHKIIVGNLVSLKVNKGQLSSWFDLYHVKS